MRTTLPLALAGSLQLATALCGAEGPRPADRPHGLVIHGGAGSIVPQNVPPAREAEYRAKLTEARDSGYKVLEQGGTALEAVVAVITILEDSPLFNAGKGAVFNADGICELDASIMDGRTLAAGAVAGVRRIKNPITLARAVMEKSSHVMLTADGAETFARLQGFVLVENSYFHTPQRREEYERSRQLEARTAALRTDAISIPQPGASLSAGGSGDSRPGAGQDEPQDQPAKFGTVGCAALDRHGNLAAGTSTGGMAYKKYGRVGDSPIIGAGTYADNATCAVSATGWGEYFIRATVARDIAAQMEFRGTSLGDAANASLAKVARLGGNGGVVCIDKDGNVALPFNTEGMYRGYRISTGATGVELFAAESRSQK